MYLLEEGLALRSRGWGPHVVRQADDVPAPCCQEALPGLGLPCTGLLLEVKSIRAVQGLSLASLMAQWHWLTIGQCICQRSRQVCFACHIDRYIVQE